MKFNINYEREALNYAETKGIIEYTVKDNMMIFISSWPMERCSYKCKVNLDTMKEEPRQKYKRYYSHGKVNYCV